MQRPRDSGVMRPQPVRRLRAPRQRSGRRRRTSSRTGQHEPTRLGVHEKRVERARHPRRRATIVRLHAANARGRVGCASLASTGYTRSGVTSCLAGTLTSEATCDPDPCVVIAPDNGGTWTASDRRLRAGVRADWIHETPSVLLHGPRRRRGPGATPPQLPANIRVGTLRADRRASRRAPRGRPYTGRTNGANEGTCVGASGSTVRAGVERCR